MFAHQRAAAALEPEREPNCPRDQLRRRSSPRDQGQARRRQAKYLARRSRRTKIEPDSWKISILYNDLGGLERKLGNLDAARDLRALAIRAPVRRAHPVRVLVAQQPRHHRSPRATCPRPSATSKAKAVALEVFPPKHPQTALVLSNLGTVYDQQDKLDKSVASYRRRSPCTGACAAHCIRASADAHRQSNT